MKQIKNDFSYGVLNNELDLRNDLNTYNNSVGSARNIDFNIFGGIKSRNGFSFEKKFLKVINEYPAFNISSSQLTTSEIEQLKQNTNITHNNLSTNAIINYDFGANDNINVIISTAQLGFTPIISIYGDELWGYKIINNSYISSKSSKCINYNAKAQECRSWGYDYTYNINFLASQYTRYLKLTYNRQKTDNEVFETNMPKNFYINNNNLVMSKVSLVNKYYYISNNNVVISGNDNTIATSKQAREYLQKNYSMNSDYINDCLPPNNTSTSFTKSIENIFKETNSINLGTTFYLDYETYKELEFNNYQIINNNNIKVEISDNNINWQTLGEYNSNFSIYKAPKRYMRITIIKIENKNYNLSLSNNCYLEKELPFNTAIIKETITSNNNIKKTTDNDFTLQNITDTNLFTIDKAEDGEIFNLDFKLSINNVLPSIMYDYTFINDGDGKEISNYYNLFTSYKDYIETGTDTDNNPILENIYFTKDYYDNEQDLINSLDSFKTLLNNQDEQAINIANNNLLNNTLFSIKEYLIGGIIYKPYNVIFTENLIQDEHYKGEFETIDDLPDSPVDVYLENDWVIIKSTQQQFIVHFETWEETFNKTIFYEYWDYTFLLLNEDTIFIYFPDYEDMNFYEDKLPNTQALFFNNNDERDCYFNFYTKGLLINNLIIQVADGTFYYDYNTNSFIQFPSYYLLNIGYNESGRNVIGLDSVVDNDNNDYTDLFNITLNNGQIIDIECNQTKFDTPIDFIFNFNIYNPIINILDNTNTIISSKTYFNDLSFFIINENVPFTITTDILPPSNDTIFKCYADLLKVDNFKKTNSRIIEWYIDDDNIFICYITVDSLTVYNTNTKFYLKVLSGTKFNDLSKIQYANFRNNLIICDGVQLPVFIYYNKATNEAKQNTNFTIPYFQKSIIKGTNQTRYIAFSKAEGLCKAETTDNFFNNDMLEQIITDGTSRFKITKYQSTKLVEGYWIYNTPDLTAATNNTGTIWNGSATMTKNVNWWIESGYEQCWNTTNGFPKSVAYFDDSLWFGGTKSQPTTIWKSKAGSYLDFKKTYKDNQNAEQFTISTQDNNIIKCMFANKGLSIFTSSGEFFVTSGNYNIDNVGTLGISDECIPQKHGVYSIFVTNNKKHIAFTKLGTFFNTLLTQLITQDNNISLNNNALNIACQLNNTDGNILMIMLDNAIVFGRFMMTDEGKKLALCPFDFSNDIRVYNVITCYNRIYMLYDNVLISYNDNQQNNEILTYDFEINMYCENGVINSNNNLNKDNFLSPFIQKVIVNDKECDILYDSKTYSYIINYDTTTTGYLKVGCKKDTSFIKTFNLAITGDQHNKARITKAVIYGDGEIRINNKTYNIKNKETLHNLTNYSDNCHLYIEGENFYIKNVIMDIDGGSDIDLGQ
jgi:hypothetical protein